MDRGLPLRQFEVVVGPKEISLPGSLVVPGHATGVVAFAHGSGSSRFSPRNRVVAKTLNESGLATLLFDLLTEEENEIDLRTRELRFDIDLLTERLIGAVDWLKGRDEAANLPVGLFGASTGAAAALRAAAERPDNVGAVVSRGGRPDLAAEALSRVRAPTLLIVGGEDTAVIGMNEDAASRLRCEYRVHIVPGATHLFEERGKMEQVSKLACEWFLSHLCRT